jgi:hypothetical protein
MFAFIYLPVIAAEEKYLRSAFPDYEGYSKEVPRFLPRLTPYRAAEAEVDDDSTRFSSALYLRHREYNAALGAVLMLGALVLKMLVKH